MAQSLFNQHENRVDYGGMLRPETGERLVFALGLTYSLDMQALLGIPVCLGMLDDVDAAQMQNPCFLLEAVRKTGDKMAVFCNAGSIRLPRSIRPFYALLESSVFPVQLPATRGNPYPNFHPKLWVVEYETETEKRIRVVTLSRNLTFDRSLDVAAGMSGPVGTRPNKRNQPLADYLKQLARHAPDPKRRAIRRLAQDLLCVKSFDLGNEFSDYAFHPIYGSAKTRYQLKLNAPDSLLVVSPFLSAREAKALGEAATYKTLITRRASVTREIYDAFDGQVYVVCANFATDDALEIADEEYRPDRDIHAKLYFTERGADRHLYLGSLNASHNAFCNNDEFLLELLLPTHRNTYGSLLAQFLPAKFSVFEQMKPEDIPPEAPAPSPGVDFRAEMAGLHGAKAVALGQGRYRIEIEYTGPQTDCQIAPLYRQNYVDLTPATVCDAIPLGQLSELFVLAKQGQKTVIKLALADYPAQERDDAIFNNIISNRSAFMAYMSYLLDNDFSDFAVEEAGALEQGGAAGQNAALPAALYEKMMRAAAYEPERLEAMADVIRRLKTDVLPAQMEEVLAQFRKATGRGKGR